MHSIFTLLQLLWVLLALMPIFSVVVLVSVGHNVIVFYAVLQDFYEDLFEELSKYGEIESLNICDNLADHMVFFCWHSFIVLLIFLFWLNKWNWLYHMSINRWVMYMFSLERKNMLQMHFEIWMEGFMQVILPLSLCPPNEHTKKKENDNNLGKITTDFE